MATTSTTWALGPQVGVVTFDPIQGLLNLTELDALPTTTGSRLNVKVADLAHAYWTAFANIELMIATAANKGVPPSKITTLGAGEATLKALGPGPISDAYNAIRHVGRWMDLDAPRAAFATWTPPTQPGTQGQGNPAAGWIVLGVVGVAAAVAASLAYYATSKAEAEASAATSQLRAMAATDAAAKVAQAQIAAGQPVDPAIAAVFSSVGAGKEANAAATQWVLAAAAGLGLAGGITGAVLWRKRK